MKKRIARPRKNCLICTKSITRANNAHKRTIRRGPDTVTCSRKCAKIYVRIAKYFSAKNADERKKFREEIKELESKLYVPKEKRK